MIYDAIRECGALSEKDVECLWDDICKKLKKESILKMDPETIDTICEEIQCCQ